MVVVADSHAVVWYLQGSKRLSTTAHEALREAERTSGFVVSVVTLIDLWYVSQTLPSPGLRCCEALLRRPHRFCGRGQIVVPLELGDLGSPVRAGAPLLCQICVRSR